MNSFIRPLSALLLASVLAGCSTIERAYDGPELPKEQVAFITGYNHNAVVAVEGLYIVGIDGKAFPHMNEYPYAIYVLPGIHDLTIEYWAGVSGTAWTSVQGQLVSVDAGRTYFIRRRLSSSRVDIWIENDEGQTIGTSEPPQLQPTLYGWRKRRGLF